MRDHGRTRHARETREGRETSVSSVACRNPNSLRSRRLKGNTGDERTRHAMDTREGRETRVTSRIF